MAEITLGGTPVHTIGELPAIGAAAPAFTLTDPDLGSLATAFVLCANDPVGVAGGVELLQRDYDVHVDVIAGPATDNRVGTRFIEAAVGVPALNARTAPERLAGHVIALLESARPESSP